MEVRLAERARLTKDIDLALRADAADAELIGDRLVSALASDPHGDRFVFVSTEPQLLQADGGGHVTWRVRVECKLSGRPFGSVQLDISPRTHELNETDRVPLPNSLDFAGVPDTIVEIIELNRHAAEKFHGMTRDFGSRENSRVRDLVDLVILIDNDLLDLARLRASVADVWRERNQSVPPPELAALSESWPSRYERMATEHDLDSGYLLRDVVNKVNEINFASSDDIHTMAHLYESMLREMRDAAGDSGEFYTPRPVIRFMVQQIAPKLGEVVLDPACGTCGFLVETLEYLRPKVRTTEQQRALSDNLRGVEKKPLPYLLGMMNLVLHGLDQPNTIRGNALSKPIAQIGRAERVDVILTNPPFGGEEEKSIQANFPSDKQTAETSWLFLQLVIRTLKDGGRCAIVAPNGLLFGDGVGSRIKQQLLAECNLHTVVRLPDGAFAPYTDIPSNLLFFDKTGRTKEVWFYELPPPDGRKKYSKTKPIRFEEFAECQTWWASREETERSWRVPVATLEANGFNLDVRNPNRPEDLAHRPPAELLAELIKSEREILDLLTSLEKTIGAA